MADYDDSELTTLDRVRGMMGDVSAPYLFSEGRVISVLKRYGITDPTADSAPQDVPEIRSAIYLLESRPGTASEVESIKQGSVTFSEGSDASADYDSILANLRRRLNRAIALNGGAGPSVADGYPNICGCL